MAFVAKDAKGFQKCLGGDVFTVSWARAGDDEPATSGKAPKAVHHPPSQVTAVEDHAKRTLTTPVLQPAFPQDMKTHVDSMSAVRVMQALLGLS